MSLSNFLQTPLLQGLSQKELLQIAAKAKISFERHVPRKKIIRQDQPATRLVILLTGEVRIITQSPCHRFRIEELTGRAPMIGLDSLFGLHQNYTCTLTAATEVETMSINKADLRDVLLLHPVVRLNVLSQLSRQASRSSLRLWDGLPAATSARFVRFLKHRLHTPVGQKTIFCRLVDLAGELSVTRLTLSRALHELQHRGLLTMGRSHIEIPAFEKLLPILSEKAQIPEIKETEKYIFIEQPRQ